MYLRYNFCIKFRTPNFEGIVFTRRLQIKRKKINIFSKIAFMPNFHQNRRICCFVSKFEMERWLDTIEVNRLSLPKTRFLRLCPFRFIEFAKSCEASRAIKLDSPSLGNSCARNFLLLLFSFVFHTKMERNRGISTVDPPEEPNENSEENLSGKTKTNLSGLRSSHDRDRPQGRPF